MLIEDVKKLSPYDRLVYWIKERVKVRELKESGASKPWTDDVILQGYRFCNVKRMEDKVSQWLLKNWYQPHFNHPNMIVACTLARQLNNTESLAALGFPDVWYPKQAEKILNQRAKEGKKNFSAAYMITGTLGGTKIEQIIHKVVTPIHKSKLKLNTDSIEKSVQMLLPFAGFSTFIAGQVVADMVFAVKGRWLDRKTWAAIGPGSRRGMNRLLSNEKEAGMNQQQFNVHLLKLIDSLKSSIPHIIKRIDAIDIQNCLCEYDKYNRCLFGEGHPKQKYQGV